LNTGDVSDDEDDVSEDDADELEGSSLTHIYPFTLFFNKIYLDFGPKVLIYVLVVKLF